MAVGTPWAIDGTTIPGKELRQMLQSLLGGSVGAFAGGISASDRAHGVVGSADLTVTQKGTPNMSVDVSSGSAFVRGTEAATQGVMWAYNDATTNLVVAAADATNPRKDLVVLQLRDDDYSGAFRDARLFIVQGTPAASPADPTPPANSLVLARVSVAALASSIVNANITDLRRRAGGLGGVVVTVSTARPTTGLYAGFEIFETDTGKAMVWDGAAWVDMGALGAWTAYTPTWSGTLGNGALTGAVRRSGRHIRWRAHLVWGTTTSHGVGIQTITLPVAVAAGYPLSSAVGWSTCLDFAVDVWAGTTLLNTSATQCIMIAGTSQVSGTAGRVSNTVPMTWGNGDTLSVGGSYESAT